MTRRGLGEFEQQVLLTILHMGGEGYSVPMVLEMEERAGREVSQAAVYIALRRLEEKGLVSSRMEPGEETESGRERRWFSVTRSGMEALRETRAPWPASGKGSTASWRSGEARRAVLHPYRVGSGGRSGCLDEREVRTVLDELHELHLEVARRHGPRAADRRYRRQLRHTPSGCSPAGCVLRSPRRRRAWGRSVGPRGAC